MSFFKVEIDVQVSSTRFYSFTDRNSRRYLHSHSVELDVQVSTTRFYSFTDKNSSSIFTLTFRR